MFGASALWGEGTFAGFLWGQLYCRAIATARFWKVGGRGLVVSQRVTGFRGVFTTSYSDRVFKLWTFTFACLAIQFNRVTFGFVA